MATRSGTPALTMLRTAVRRKSWRCIPGAPAASHAAAHAFLIHASLVVLRRAGLQAQRAGLEVELAPLEREDFALHAPAARVRDRDGRLEVRREEPADGLVLIALEEALARWALLRLLLAPHDVGVDDGLPDRRDAPPGEETIQTLNAAGVFLQVARARRLVVLLEIRRDFLVPNPISSREHGLPGGRHDRRASSA